MQNFSHRMVVLGAVTSVLTTMLGPPAQAETNQTRGWKTSVLVEGAPLKGGSNGLAFDAGDACPHRLSRGPL